MGSLARQYTEEKLFGQIYTPHFLVEKILDDVGFAGLDALGKTVLDPACGDGQILMEVVGRILEFSSKEDLEKNLYNIHGWDIDSQAIIECQKNLNELISQTGITINWNIREANAIMLKEQFRGRFDFIVGNPPYIRIQHLALDTRKFIQENYEYCHRGSTDMYIAFFELSLSLVSADGFISFVTPNSYFYSQTAKALRLDLIKHKYVAKLSNYGHILVFDKASTYSAITTLSKSPKSGFVFEEAYTMFDFISKYISYETIIKTGGWQFSVSKEYKQIGKRLGDIAKINVGITTLCDKVYVVRLKRFEGCHAICETNICGEVRFEAELLRPIIKVSRFNGEAQQNLYIIFPYTKVNGKNSIIDEIKLQESYPFLYNYLCINRNILDKRDNGKINSVSWYAFGRSQGLDLDKRNRILFSPMNKKPDFIIDRTDSLIFSGYCISYDGDLTLLAEQLNSVRMRDYISISSRDFRGGWKAYNKTVVQEFYVDI